MSRSSRRRNRVIAEINVVPYIDVMLVLLVIFMITVPLLNQGVELDLPQAAAQALPVTDSRSLILEVDRTGAYYLHRAGEPPQQVDHDTALARAAAVLLRYPGTPVLVRADRGVDYGAVVQAMVLLQQAGAPKVGLATEPPAER